MKLNSIFDSIYMQHPFNELISMISFLYSISMMNSEVRHSPAGFLETWMLYDVILFAPNCFNAVSASC